MSSYIETRHEGPRGCGYRKKGGTYLIGGKLSEPCGKLPRVLTICPTCYGGIHFSRGWTWIDAVPLFKPLKCRIPSKCEEQCPLSTEVLSLGETWKAGLLWVGEKFYSTSDNFTLEAANLGISRRIANIPREFKLGETWVFLAHKKAGIGENGEAAPAIFSFFKPHAIEYVVRGDETEEELEKKESRGITLVNVVNPTQAELPFDSQGNEEEEE